MNRHPNSAGLTPAGARKNWSKPKVITASVKNETKTTSKNTPTTPDASTIGFHYGS
jgi:hypothetical protein